MTDTRKLLERCAKVMGWLLYVEDCDGWIHVDSEGNRGAWWNPLASLADAAELAIKCKVDVTWSWQSVPVMSTATSTMPAQRIGTRSEVVHIIASCGIPHGVVVKTKDHPTEQAAYCYAVVNVVAQMAEGE